MSTPTAVVVGVGAERGLGAALCRHFAANAYHVMVADRTTEKIEQVVQTIRAKAAAPNRSRWTRHARAVSSVSLIGQCRRAIAAIRPTLSYSMPVTTSASISASLRRNSSRHLENHSQRAI